METKGQKLKDAEQTVVISYDIVLGTKWAFWAKKKKLAGHIYLILFGSKAIVLSKTRRESS